MERGKETEKGKRDLNRGTKANQSSGNGRKGKRLHVTHRSGRKKPPELEKEGRCERKKEKKDRTENGRKKKATKTVTGRETQQQHWDERYQKNWALTEGSGGGRKQEEGRRNGREEKKRRPE